METVTKEVSKQAILMLEQLQENRKILGIPEPSPELLILEMQLVTLNCATTAVLLNQIEALEARLLRLEGDSK